MILKVLFYPSIFKEVDICRGRAPWIKQMRCVARLAGNFVTCKTTTVPHPQSPVTSGQQFKIWYENWEYMKLYQFKISLLATSDLWVPTSYIIDSFTVPISGPYDQSNRGLNPTKKDIINILSGLKGDQRSNQQQQLLTICDELREDGNYVFFQPYISEVGQVFWRLKLYRVSHHGPTDFR